MDKPRGGLNQRAFLHGRWPGSAPGMSNLQRSTKSSSSLNFLARYSKSGLELALSSVIVEAIRCAGLAWNRISSWSAT
jgi:hypothetical protein